MAKQRYLRTAFNTLTRTHFIRLACPLERLVGDYRPTRVAIAVVPAMTRLCNANYGVFPHTGYSNHLMRLQAVLQYPQLTGVLGLFDD